MGRGTRCLASSLKGLWWASYPIFCRISAWCTVSEDMRKRHLLGMRVRKTRFRRLGHNMLQFRRGYIQKLDLLGLVRNFERSHWRDTGQQLRHGRGGETLRSQSKAEEGVIEEHNVWCLVFVWVVLVMSVRYCFWGRFHPLFISF